MRKAGCRATIVPAIEAIRKTAARRWTRAAVGVEVSQGVVAGTGTP